MQQITNDIVCITRDPLQSVEVDDDDGDKKRNFHFGMVKARERVGFESEKENEKKEIHIIKRTNNNE